MSSAVSIRRIPPATRNAASVTPNILKMRAPKNAKKKSSRAPATHARSAIESTLGRESRAGIAITRCSKRRTSHAQLELPHHGEAFDEDLAAHLRLTDAAIFEQNGDLFDAEAGLQRAVLQLDLKCIP